MTWRTRLAAVLRHLAERISPAPKPRQLRQAVPPPVTHVHVFGVLTRLDDIESGVMRIIKIRRLLSEAVSPTKASAVKAGSRS